MAAVSFLVYLLFSSVLLDWACRSKMLRRALYAVLMAAGITTCTQLGPREVLHLDGGMWGMVLALAGFRLLFKRSQYRRAREG